MGIFRRSATIALAFGLVGCVTTQGSQEDPMVWGRVDCQRMTEHPELVPEFEQAKAVCENRAQADAIAGTANMPGGYGVYGAIAAGVNQGITAASIQQKTTISCMAERGYLLKLRSQHVAACAAAHPPPAPVVVAQASKTKKRQPVAEPSPSRQEEKLVAPAPQAQAQQ